MPIFRKSTEQVLFIHIPKCGGSSIEKVLSSSSDETLLFGLNEFQCSPQHFHGKLLQALIPNSDGINSFSVVRHPILRFISEHQYRNRLRIKHKKKPMQLDEDAKHCIFEYKANPFIYDNHIRPQIEYPLRNTKLFTLENGLEAPISFALKLLSGGQDSEAEKIPFEKKSPTSDIVINCKTLLRLQEFYYHDFEFLGYSRLRMKPSERISFKELKIALTEQLTVSNFNSDVVTEYHKSLSKSKLNELMEFGEKVTRNAIKKISYPFVSKQ